MKRTEHIEQREFVAWFRVNHPEHKIFAIPNGGHRHALTAHKLKLEGVSAGIPDLFIPSLLLWVEMKTETGKLSKHQKEWIDYLQSVGHRCVVAYGFEDAKKQVSPFVTKQ